MQTTIVKWDEGMAARCMARSERNPAKIETPAPEVKVRTIVMPVKATPEKALSIDIAAGEWDGFEYALNSALKKKHN